VEATPDSGRATDLERVPTTKRRKILGRVDEIRYTSVIPPGAGTEVVQGDAGGAITPEEGERPATEPLSEAARAKALRYLQDLFADIEARTGKRYPKLETSIESADIGAQRELYRLIREIL